MNCQELIELHHRLEHMHDIFTRLLPINELSTHPFTHFRNQILGVYAAIDNIILDSEKKCASLETHNKSVIYQINQYRIDLGLDSVELELSSNLSVANETLCNELHNLTIMRGKLEDEIRILKNEIEEIVLWIGDEFIEDDWKNVYKGNMYNCEVKCDLVSEKQDDGKIKENEKQDDRKINVSEKQDDRKISLVSINDYNNISSEITVKNLEILKNKIIFLKNKKKTLEESREMIYSEIRDIRILLGKDYEFSHTESISELRKQARSLGKKLENNKKIFNQLVEKSKLLESFLKLKGKNININYSDEAIDDLRKYCEMLADEKNKYFKEIYMHTRDELLEISRIFSLEIVEYTEDEDGLNEMMNKIKELAPKKDMFCEIGNLIEKRKMFIEKMTEFEKIASDPRRLFKSSFQLNSEEKFRNTAYPSLLNLEKNIFELIEKYEKVFDKLVFEGLEYKKVLKNEIENRIINRTVFISRCESPFKKRK